MDPKQFGKMIQFHRKKCGITQEELGKLAGLGKTVVFDAEKGKLSIRFDTLLKLLHVLNVTLNFDSPLMELFKESLNEKS